MGVVIPTRLSSLRETRKTRRGSSVSTPCRTHRRSRSLCTPILFAVDYFRHALRLAQLGPEDALDVCPACPPWRAPRHRRRELEVRVTSLADLVVETQDEVGGNLVDNLGGRDAEHLMSRMWSNARGRPGRRPSCPRFGTGA